MTHLSPNTVGLFGTCGGSTWREPFKEMFAQQGIACYDPQVEGWTPGLAEEEAWHLANDQILVFPVTSETYEFGSLADSGFSIMAALATNANRYVLLFIDENVDEALTLASPEQADASRRARKLVLAHLAKMNHPNVHLAESLDDLLEMALQLCASFAHPLDLEERMPERPGQDLGKVPEFPDKPTFGSSVPDTQHFLPEDSPRRVPPVFPVEAQEDEAVSPVEDSAEEVAYQAYLSWWAFLPRLGMAFVLTIVGIAALYYGQGGLLRYLAWAGLPGLLAIPFFILKKQSVTAYVTAHHVIVEAQLISLRTTTLNLHRIESVDIHQTFVQRVLGFGTVVVRGLGSEDISLAGLSCPARFKEAVLAVRSVAAL